MNTYPPNHQSPHQKPAKTTADNTGKIPSKNLSVLTKQSFVLGIIYLIVLILSLLALMVYHNATSQPVAQTTNQQDQVAIKEPSKDNSPTNPDTKKQSNDEKETTNSTDNSDDKPPTNPENNQKPVQTNDQPNDQTTGQSSEQSTPDEEDDNQDENQDVTPIQPPDEVPNPNIAVGPPTPPTNEVETTTIDDQYPHISAELKLLVAQMDLTDEGKRILYGHNPVLADDRSTIQTYCSNSHRHYKQSNSEIYGCWMADKIYILNEGPVHSIIAHELLHGVYYQMTLSNSLNEINQAIRETQALYPQKSQQVLEPYQESFMYKTALQRRYATYNELHSFMGTEFAQLPSILENHYAQYFKNRLKIVNFYETWEQEMQQRNSEIQTRNLKIQQSHELYSLQRQEYMDCLLFIAVEINNCREYQPNYQQYVDYRHCLSNMNRPLNDCDALKPEFIDYN